MLSFVIMRDIHCHVDAEDLERYSMGTGSPEATPLIEQHLLTCGACQERLLETDDYLRAMRTSAKQLRWDGEAAKGRAWEIPSRFPALLAVACGIVLVVAAPRFIRPAEPLVAVSLTALRGDGAGNSAPSGRELMLHPDLTGLAEGSWYRLEIVDETGRAVRQGKLTQAQKGIQVPGLGSGLYFVRVYLPAGELLREYGLRIR